MAPLNSRSASRNCRRMLTSEAAPTSAAASGPSRTTAASVADELGDHFVCRDVSGFDRVADQEQDLQDDQGKCRPPAADVRYIGPRCAAPSRGHQQPGEDHDEADIEPCGPGDHAVTPSRAVPAPP